MRRYLWAAFGLISIATSASAADLNRAPAYKAPTYAAPSWAGFYIGANGGYATGKQDGQLQSSPCATGCTLTPDYANFPGSSNVSLGGGFGGGQAGYNWQIGRTVFGIETDFDAGSISGSGTFNGTNWSGWEWDKQLDAKVDWFGTVRGRLGYDLGGLLLYGTGGLAYGHDTMHEAVTQHSGIGGLVYNSGVGSFDETRVGWTAGAGLEYALGANWSVKAEYLHVDLPGKTSTFSGNMLTPAGANAGAWAQDGLDSKITLDTVKAGVNYRW